MWRWRGKKQHQQQLEFCHSIRPEYLKANGKTLRAVLIPRSIQSIYKLNDSSHSKTHSVCRCYWYYRKKNEFAIFFCVGVVIFIVFVFRFVSLLQFTPVDCTNDVFDTYSSRFEMEFVWPLDRPCKEHDVHILIYGNEVKIATNEFKFWHKTVTIVGHCPMWNGPQQQPKNS